MDIRITLPQIEFRCIWCGFPNPKEVQFCLMCRRDKQGSFYPIKEEQCNEQK